MIIPRYVLSLSNEASFYFLTSAFQFVVKLKATAATACVTANVVVAICFTATVRQTAFIGICGSHKQCRKSWFFCFNKQTSQRFSIFLYVNMPLPFERWRRSKKFLKKFINDLLTDASLSRSIYLKSHRTWAPVSSYQVDTFMTAASVVDLTFIDI